MPLWTALLLAVLPAAAGDELGPVELANDWVRQCVLDNPGRSSGDDPWTAACVRLQDPCLTQAKPMQGQIERCGACLESATKKTTSCVIPKAPRIERPPAGSSPAEVIDDSEACIKYFIKLTVWEQAIRDIQAKKEHAIPSPTKIACGMYDILVHLRELDDDSPAKQADTLEMYYPTMTRWYAKKGRKLKGCSPLKLRDAQHYFQNYCDYKEEWTVRNFPNVFCSITAGYSAGKAIGIVPRTGKKKPSPPSKSEVYWGCNGIWHAQDGAFPFMKEGEYRTPP
jgi:hypothetical protein